MTAVTNHPNANELHINPNPSQSREVAPVKISITLPSGEVLNITNDSAHSSLSRDGALSMLPASPIEPANTALSAPIEPANTAISVEDGEYPAVRIQRQIRRLKLPSRKMRIFRRIAREVMPIARHAIHMAAAAGVLYSINYLANNHSNIAYQATSLIEASMPTLASSTQAALRTNVSEVFHNSLEKTSDTIGATARFIEGGFHAVEATAYAVYYTAIAGYTVVKNPVPSLVILGVSSLTWRNIWRAF